MRILVFFDLPTITAEDRRHYRIFRKMLIKNGFVMLQESVYCRLMTTPNVERSVKKMIYEYRPPTGIIQTLTLTEKQFVKMEYIVGKNNSDVIDSNDRLVIL